LLFLPSDRLNFLLVSGHHTLVLFLHCLKLLQQLSHSIRCRVVPCGSWEKRVCLRVTRWVADGC
jgi:hypothetical protein